MQIFKRRALFGNQTVVHLTFSQIDETPSQKPRRHLRTVRGFVLFDVDRNLGRTLRGESKFLAIAFDESDDGRCE